MINLVSNEVLVVPYEKFRQMLDVDVSGMTETRLGLTYLPWAEAELLLRQFFPTFKVVYEIEEVNRDGNVYTAVLARIWDIAENKYTLPEYFPVMEGSKQRQASANCTTREISDAIKRASVKVIARETGIGFNLYRKEKDDLPEEKLERTAQPYAPKEDTRDLEESLSRKSTFKKLV